MSVRERIATIRLIERYKDNEDLAKRIGVSVGSDLRKDHEDPDKDDKNR